MKKSIDEASASELANFAHMKYGIETDYRTGKAKIIAQLQAVGHTSTEIEIADASTQAPAPASAKPETSLGRVKVLIPETDAPGGSEPVPVGVNGKVWLIKRGEPVPIPPSVLEVLENAKRVVFQKGPNGEPINPRYVHVYPFSVIAA